MLGGPVVSANQWLCSLVRHRKIGARTDHAIERAVCEVENEDALVIELLLYLITIVTKFGVEESEEGGLVEGCRECQEQCQKW